MKKILCFCLPLFAVAQLSFAQSAKKQAPIKGGNTTIPSEKKIVWPGKNAVPPAENAFGWPGALPEARPLERVKPVAQTARVTHDADGTPIFFTGQNEASAIAENKTVAEQGVAYVAALKPSGLENPLQEFRPSRSEHDAEGEWHVRLDQYYQGIPVYGGEMIAHTHKGRFDVANGRYFPTPRLASVTPAVSDDQAIGAVQQHIGSDKIKTDWTEQELAMIGQEQPFRAELVVFHVKGDFKSERLAWLVTARPNVLRYLFYFVDAQTGAVLDHYDNTCRIAGHHHEAGAPNCAPFAYAPTKGKTLTALNGPVTATGTDLAGQTRTFGAWMEGSVVALADCSKDMFNLNATNSGNDFVGAIVTYNAKGTSPENNNFAADYITSNNTTFTNPTGKVHPEGVSAHFNAGKCYDYYKNTFSRKSIDGVGGNILSFANVTEADGSSMENAYWNGNAMFYGRGGTAFKELAGSLDVAGHEMTHGVIQSTANLIYQNESGALNESFADVFGAMIEREDWKIGEDIMRPGVHSTGALRDMQNPNNGAAQLTDFWQPKHYSERYTGTQDNGGVHINSGIVNLAYYLFATNASVGLAKAEQVYYKALKDYLVKSSKFIDCRLAVVQAAKDLYGTAVADIAAAAFTSVGIGTSSGTQTGGNYLGQLAVNPGQDFIFCVSNNYQNLDLATGTGTVLGTLYNQGLLSRPSIRDNGTEFVFVDKQNRIIAGTLKFQNGVVTPQLFILEDQIKWRNAAISKDGRYVAALELVEKNIITIFDLLSPTGAYRDFELYNPTTSQDPKATDDVRFADVLEFDYSGNYLMYDAYNEIAGVGGDTLSYWDISFLEFRKNGQFAPATGAFITKLFNTLPENTSVGNPTLAKNSPYIIAFDYIDDAAPTDDEKYYVVGYNYETGDEDLLVNNNFDLGWPAYNRLDNAVIYEGPAQSGAYNLYRQSVEASKIKGKNDETVFIQNHVWGVWFANGARSLQVVDAKEPNAVALQLQVSPNPTRDVAQVSFQSPNAMSGQLMLCDIMGRTLQSAQVSIAEGPNNFDVDLQQLPQGTYMVRIAAGGLNAVVKLVRGE